MFSSKFTEYRKLNESTAKQEIEDIKEIEIKEWGLFIDTDKPYLGASPDGLIGENGIVEIKCPYSAANMTPPHDAIQQKKSHPGKLIAKEKWKLIEIINGFIKYKASYILQKENSAF